MLAIEKKALEDFQDMMNIVESDFSHGFSNNNHGQIILILKSESHR